MSSALFVAYQNVLDVFLLVKLVINVQNRAAGVTEDVLNTFILKELDKDLRTTQFHCSSPLNISKRLREDCDPALRHEKELEVTYIGAEDQATAGELSRLSARHAIVSRGYTRKGFPDMSCGRTYLLLLLVSLFPSASLAQVYKWVDDEGKVHYGQNRPHGGQAKAMELRPAPVSRDDASLELEKLRLKAGLGSDNQEQQETQQQAAAEVPEAVRKENCRIARDNFAALLQKRRIVRTDENGNLIRLDDNEKAARLEQAKQQITKFCNQ